MNGEEEVIYHDMSPKSAYIAPTPPPPPPQQIPSGSAEEEEPPQPKKKCSLLTKVCIGSILLMAIILSVTLTRPGALMAFGRKPDSVEGVTAELTYAPTYWPTYMPTYMPTVAATEAVETTVAATEAATTTEAAAVVEDDGNDTTTEAPIDSDLDFSWMVFKIQFTPSSVNATYSFSSKESGAVYSSIEAGELPLDVMTEEKVCVPAGEYEYTMSSGACVNGFYRGQLILYSCNEGTITVTVQEAPQQV
eukprot:scaffold3353_cov144-Skeletonema_menzelii.AAC.2